MAGQQHLNTERSHDVVIRTTSSLLNIQRDTERLLQYIQYKEENDTRTYIIVGKLHRKRNTYTNFHDDTKEENTDYNTTTYMHYYNSNKTH